MATKKPLKCLFIKAGESDIEKFATTMEIERGLSNYYELIGCDLVEMPVRRINGVSCTIICDEEFLLKNDPTPCGQCMNYREMFCGNVIIAGNRGYNITSLNDEQIGRIMDSISKFTATNNNTGEAKTMCLFRYSI